MADFSSHNIVQAVAMRDAERKRKARAKANRELLLACLIGLAGMTILFYLGAN